MHRGDSHPLAQKSGAETVTLTAAEIAAHTHTAKASSAGGDNPVPTGRLLASEAAPDLAYRDAEAASMTAMRSGTVTNAGGGQAHNNMQPYTTVTFCIALQGLFPSRN